MLCSDLDISLFARAINITNMATYLLQRGTWTSIPQYHSPFHSRISFQFIPTTYIHLISLSHDILRVMKNMIFVSCPRKIHIKK